MIADVIIIEPGFEQLNQLDVAMPKVEHPTVAMQIEQSFGAVNVPDVGSLAWAHDQIHAVFLKKCGLA